MKRARSNKCILAPSLLRVQRGNLCAGCGGCALVAPDKVRMEMTSPGYLRPRQVAPITSEQDATIAQICPGLGQTVVAKGRTDDILWGPYKRMESGHSTDVELRFTASSGGGLSALLIYLLETGAVDAVIQTGADPDVPVANTTVISRTREEVLAAAGSRYGPSAPLADLSELLDTDLRYVFVGKPCDVAALRALQERDTRIQARIPVMFSFFCAGVPSQAGAEKVIEQLGFTLAEIKAFRYRGYGWPGRTTATLHDGREVSMTYHESWGAVLSAHTQLRCKICADGTGKAADIVFADAWESDEKGYPIFEENDGTSLIVARTDLGVDLLIAAKAAAQLSAQAFDVASLRAIQPGQLRRRQVLVARLAGLRITARPIPRYQGLHLFAAARTGRGLDSLKNFLGTLRRALLGRV